MDEPSTWLDKAPFLAALAGGALDYFRQLQIGRRRFSLWAFFLHLALAVFFGWLCGQVVQGLGYNSDMALGFAGFGGFLGVRVADLIYLMVGQRGGREN